MDFEALRDEILTDWVRRLDYETVLEIAERSLDVLDAIERGDYPHWRGRTADCNTIMAALLRKEASILAQMKDGERGIAAYMLAIESQGGYSDLITEIADKLAAEENSLSI